MSQTIIREVKEETGIRITKFQ
ncbi:NUDIX hydrolase [Companilactobacillus kimchiensis]|nr:NUDIX hydrolase [Companilactobacillus kimchiensis]